MVHSLGLHEVGAEPIRRADAVHPIAAPRSEPLYSRRGGSIRRVVRPS
ncbi:hypothetical protein J2Z21_002610 [Streptomyces griseochromogenes]|uniref:Uncharacterized protein n=1 Tax=Streptomyces griseochromogenes TaxID=68214 RepID=A0ABS4LQJ2_9ACTN|nr:hypothetical protein [Streptomyces griseochromogenes]